MRINLNNRSFLREHPDAPPWVDSSFVKNHSFIFPGDELVLYNGINLPGDAGAASMSQITFLNVKCSIIAKKPNIFSGIFSSVFKATRSFTLDSFSLSFNNKNAAAILYGTDGYAPNINYQTDRNWELPEGNFKRQVNMFTSHTSGTSNWTYWFYFPILFRWEYWKNLPSADNDFVSSTSTSTGKTTVLNNQTQRWVNYALNPAWQIISHCELNLLVNGQPVTLVSDLQLNRETTSIQSFASNPDYTNKYTASSKVGGIPLNNPCPLYTDQNTSVFAYFTKVATWSYREQSNISCFIWIEVFEGAGEPQRLRASSSFEATPESCFINLQQPILNDDGSPLLNDLGDPILKDPCGVLTYFDGQNIKFEAQIDYNKLNASFPNATGFNVYARIYNKTVYTV